MGDGYHPPEGFASAFSRRSGPPLPPLQMFGSVVLGSNPLGGYVVSNAQPMTPIPIPVKGPTVNSLPSVNYIVNPNANISLPVNVSMPNRNTVTNNCHSSLVSTVPTAPTVGSYLGRTIGISRDSKVRSAAGTRVTSPVPRMVIKTEPTSNQPTPNIPFVGTSVQPMLRMPKHVVSSSSLRFRSEDGSEEYLDPLKDAPVSQIGIPSTNSTIDDVVNHIDVKTEPLHETSVMENLCRIVFPVTNHTLTETIPLQIKTEDTAGELLGEKDACASQIGIPPANPAVNDMIPHLDIKLEPLCKTPLMKSDAVPRSLLQYTSLSSHQPVSISKPDNTKVFVIDDSMNKKVLVDFFAQKGWNRSCVTPIGSPGTTEDTAGGHSHPKYLRNVPLEGQTKLLIYNITRYFEDLKHMNGLNLNICQVVSAATGLANRTVSRIWNEGKKMSIENPESIPKFCSAKPKVGYRFKKVKSDLNIDRIIRKCILERYANSETPQSLECIVGACKREGMSALLGWRYVRSRLSKLGLDMVQCRRRKICIERPEITVWRLNYLCDMKKYTKEKKNMVFLFEENVIMTCGQRSELWLSREDVEHIREDVRMHMPMLSVMHAASSREGFVDGCLYFRESTYTHLNDETRCANMWLKYTVLPSIPKGSVVILGHRRYDTKEDMVLRPNADSSKQEILEWLRTNGDTSLNASYRHAVLLDRANQIRVEQQCCIDSTIIESGHIPLHLPPFHRDLNPVEMIWRDIPKKFGKGKADAPKSVEELKTRITREIALCNGQDLLKAWGTVQKQEQFYRKVDAAVDRELPKVVARMGGVVKGKEYVEADSESLSDEETEQVVITGDVDIDEDSDGPAPPKKSKKCRE